MRGKVWFQHLQPHALSWMHELPDDIVLRLDA